MAERRAPIPPSLFTSTEKRQQQARAAPPPLPTVTHVILWTLLNAGIIFLSLALAFTPAFDTFMDLMLCLINHPPLQSRMAYMTDAEVAVADGLFLGMLWSAAAQAAAGALALMVPSRRRRRLRIILAYAALVATAASHSMFAGLDRMLVAAGPGGGLCFMDVAGTATIFIYGVGDLVCFLALILRRGEE